MNAFHQDHRVRVLAAGSIAIMSAAQRLQSEELDTIAGRGVHAVCHSRRHPPVNFVTEQERKSGWLRSGDRRDNSLA